MKIKPIILSMALLVSISCKKEQQKEVLNQVEQVKPADSISEKTTDQNSFNYDALPVSNKDIGMFPFFSLPAEMVFEEPPIERKFDVVHFAINDKLIPVEGHSMKGVVIFNKNSTETWSQPYFEKSFDEAIKNAGGVKVFDGNIQSSETDKIKDNSIRNENGFIGYNFQHIKTYIIKRPDGQDVYLQLTGDTKKGKINILQKTAFTQTISKINATQISKDLAEKGKSVLHINFDTDKATLKPEGVEAVSEIVKSLQADPNLKIAINGHTDNTGNPQHNLKLSKDRALTVLNAIVSSGIDKERLSSNGFGDENPIAVNTTEEGKAENRRVELIKR